MFVWIALVVVIGFLFFVVVLGVAVLRRPPDMVKVFFRSFGIHVRWPSERSQVDESPD